MVKKKLVTVLSVLIAILLVFGFIENLIRLAKDLGGVGTVLATLSFLLLGYLSTHVLKLQKSGQIPWYGSPIFIMTLIAIAVLVGYQLYT